MSENCPYCNAELEINHDDGRGYSEDEIHQQECHSCNMVFAFTTSICLYYEPKKADCLNGSPHNWEPQPQPYRPDYKVCAWCGEVDRGRFDQEKYDTDMAAWRIAKKGDVNRSGAC